MISFSPLDSIAMDRRYTRPANGTKFLRGFYDDRRRRRRDYSGKPTVVSASEM